MLINILNWININIFYILQLWVLPTVIIEYISEFSNPLLLVNINKLYNFIFSERVKRFKIKFNVNSNRYTIIEIKKFKESEFTDFDFYLFHHVKILNK